MSVHSHLFPVTLQTKWMSVSNFSPHELNKTMCDKLIDWLLEPSSLTARLKSHCSEFRVEVLGQQVSTCSELEANDDIILGEDVLVREVLLFCDNKPQVFARSLLPLKSLTGDEKKLAKLGEQPLGQVIFNQPDLVRKRIEIGSFTRPSSLSNLISQLDLCEQEPLWGRRSIFVLKNKPIMVAEVFLPDSFAYQQHL